MICSYCQTENESNKICIYCKADLTAVRPALNLNLDDSATDLTQPELNQLHTYDLLRLLSHLRSERTFAYKNMQLVRKAPEMAKKGEYEEINSFGQSHYRDITKRMQIVEQLLIDRMGYFPKRVDDKLLIALKNKIERGNAHETRKNR